MDFLFYVNRSDNLMLDSKVGRFFVALKKRRLISVKTLREDSRKLGLVLVGSGLLAIMLKGDWIGVVPVLVGIVLLFVGLTWPRRTRKTKQSKKVG